jgi:hypothetical protein
MIIHSVVQSAMTRARRRNRQRLAAKRALAAQNLERTDAPQFRRLSRREDLGTMVVVVLFVAFVIGFFIAR